MCIRDRPGPSAHELAVLVFPGYSSHQNVIAYRKMRQSLAPISHAVPLKPSHRRIDPAVSGPLQVGASSESRPRPAPRSRGNHGAPPGIALRNPAKPPPTPYRVWVRPPQRRLHAAHNLFRRKLVAPSSTSAYLTLACTQTGPPGRVTQRGSRSPQQFSSPGRCTIVYGNCPRNTRHPCRRCATAWDVGVPFAPNTYARSRWSQ